MIGRTVKELLDALKPAGEVYWFGYLDATTGSKGKMIRLHKTDLITDLRKLPLDTKAVAFSVHAWNYQRTQHYRGYARAVYLNDFGEDQIEPKEIKS